MRKPWQSEHVTHAKSAEDFVATERDIESRRLARAVKMHLECRLMLKGHKMVALAVWLYGRFNMSLCEVEEMLPERAWYPLNEPHGICRKLQLLRKWSYDEQDGKQVFA
ncbi:hypothetical protein [Rhizobium sp. PAMB 3182]